MNKINLKVYFRKRKQRVSFFGISPDFDWKFILVFIGILLAVGIFIAVYLYINLNNDSLLQTEVQFDDTISDTQKMRKIETIVNSISTSSTEPIFDETMTN